MNPPRDRGRRFRSFCAKWLWRLAARIEPPMKLSGETCPDCEQPVEMCWCDEAAARNDFLTDQYDSGYVDGYSEATIRCEEP